ncbi:metallophosphoesterase [Halorubrum ezzemoulense]|uniref:Protein tyrosine phosphatase n=1 Tax=Halorubrum ezzemoulense TaxID=337243 RepID=A0A256JGR6_HALEZ|nr:metallophosphoesterase [Halorubrum ezzemoulense]OYR68074.1 protein tyrosine phosphatase [Halorubrum ezzemoulense]
MSVPPATVERASGDPLIVHVSDIHGYLTDARSALLAVGDSGQYPDLVRADESDRLHWADNDYVLVVNGDVIDRGPANEECLEMVWRLQEEAPPGRVRYQLGNHELAILLPSFVRWPGAYSTGLDAADRREFLRRASEGAVTAAFEGYQYRYSHAGQNEPFDVTRVNDVVRNAASELLAVDGDDRTVQKRLERRHGRVFALGSDGGRGPDAGLCWLDFTHLDPSAPPQIVGHTKRVDPVRNGNVVCGNIIRMNHRSAGGEGVLIESADSLEVVRRKPDGSVSVSSV